MSNIAKNIIFLEIEQLEIYIIIEKNRTFAPQIGHIMSSLLME